MPFDQTTRNRLQRFVIDARKVLEQEFTRQLQSDYGMDPNTGAIGDLKTLTHLNDAQRETARILRQSLAHYRAHGDMDSKQGLERIVREQSFTVLNRLSALRMAESRGLLIESVGNGLQSKGFQLYSRLCGTAFGELADAYRAYLFSLFDELARDLPVLFERFSPFGRLFPRESALLPLLNLINHPEIDPFWSEDETIGWIYQYFNSKEERKAMRDASQAPRNSRELAVRNQFFTPRYVVEFLVDNSLGQLWFDATSGDTSLRDRCQYLLVKKEKITPPNKKVRDPRTLKLLDPACGSMHFGLYAFNLFEQIYDEAWEWESLHGPGSLDVSTESRRGLKPLTETYSDRISYLFDVPRLIIEHNIFGIDIDPRAAQIAALALWLRAQRAWHERGVKANNRPTIGHGHVLAATAPPAEPDLRQQFGMTLAQEDAELFERIMRLLNGLPEMGVLLRVERDIPHLLSTLSTAIQLSETTQLHQEWFEVSKRLRNALSEYAESATSTYQARLFAQDALQCLRLIDLCYQIFDVVVMNPPFGLLAINTKDRLVKAYPRSKNDLLAIFVERGLELLRHGGRIGAITSRTCFFLSSYQKWREEIVLGDATPEVMADLGHGVMDDAMVEAAAYVLEKKTPTLVKVGANM